ncbi:IPTL-CTERM sorting domain-containing protein, partial [uncultured Brevundimonas sp.]
VPTMSEWAMILLGTILAGGAALYIQRQQRAI